MNYPALATLAFLMAVTTSVHADCIRRPGLPETRSPNGQFSVHATPGNRIGDLRGFEDYAKGGQFATAEWRRLEGGSPAVVRTATLLNPISPAELMVADDGTLVTIDNWCNYGIGTALAIYSPRGDLLGKFALSDFYSPEDIRRLQSGNEGQIWRCGSASSLSLAQPNELWVDDIIRGRLIVKLDTGTISYQRGGGACVSNAPETVAAAPDDDPELAEVRVHAAATRMQLLDGWTWQKAWHGLI